MAHAHRNRSRRVRLGWTLVLVSAFIPAVVLIFFTIGYFLGIPATGIWLGVLLTTLIIGLGIGLFGFLLTIYGDISNAFRLNPP